MQSHNHSRFFKVFFLITHYLQPWPQEVKSLINVETVIKCRYCCCYSLGLRNPITNNGRADAVSLRGEEVTVTSSPQYYFTAVLLIIHGGLKWQASDCRPVCVGGRPAAIYSPWVTAGALTPGSYLWLSAHKTLGCPSFVIWSLRLQRQLWHRLSSLPPPDNNCVPPPSSGASLHSPLSPKTVLGMLIRLDNHILFRLAVFPPAGFLEWLFLKKGHLLPARTP